MNQELSNKVIAVSVGIPAYNEQANIKNLLSSILSQKEEGFVLKEIIVISDQSTDNTIAEAKSLGDERIIVQNSVGRGGKAPRFMDLARQFTGDLLVQFDADVQLAHPFVLKALVDRQRETAADLVCANITPLSPRTFYEKLAYFGIDIWQNFLKLIKEKELPYRCQGRGRLFTRAYLTNYQLPDEAAPGEDAYSFLYAVTNGYTVAFAKDALLYYRLPSTKADFMKQSRRFIGTHNVLLPYFGQEVFDRYYGIAGFSLKIRALLMSIIKFSPITSIGYIISQIIAHKTAQHSDVKAVWEDVASTKQLL